MLNKQRGEKCAVLCVRVEMYAKVGSKALGGKKKNIYQQCSRSSFKTISTTHLAQGPVKTHNITHRYCIYTTKSNEKVTLTTVAQYAVQLLCQLVAVT